MRIDEIFRTEYGRILATLIRVLGDFDVAEDALQEAFATALEQWPAAGLPTNPVAWLIGTARHKAIDRLRRRSRLARKEAEIARHIELSTAEEEAPRSEEHTSELQSRLHLVCRLLLEKKKITPNTRHEPTSHTDSDIQ